MQQVKVALELTTSHGLPRTVTRKPLIVRIAWVLLFLAFMGLFLKGFADFVAKLQTRQVTSAQETDVVPFKFPDVYACFENSISTSYAAAASNDSIDEINRQLQEASNIFQLSLTAGYNISDADVFDNERWYSFAYVQSLQYNLLADALAHRLEQSVVTSDVTYVNSNGLPYYDPVTPDSFYHPVHLRCIRWLLNSTVKATLAKSGTSSGLVVTLLTDSNFSALAPTSPPIMSKVYAGGSPIPVSDWSLSRLDFDDPDRRAGVRIFLCPPGEYPTAFVTSFSLGPGRYHTVEISMTEQVYNPASFDDCLSDPDPVQFVNPYSQEPYNHSYSYSYCYFYEYHKQYQAIMNLSGDASPLPWPLRGGRYLFNLTGPRNFLQMSRDSASGLVPDSELLSRVSELAQSACRRNSPCTTTNYDVTISSTDWPTYSSVSPFVRSTVSQALGQALAKNKTVPALTYLVSASAADAVAYIEANLLKVNFKPRRVNCNRVTLSIEYGVANFISDIGGIMGIYLGMSLLTLCEVLELIYDLAVVAYNRGRRDSMRPPADPPEETGNGHCVLTTQL